MPHLLPRAAIRVEIRIPGIPNQELQVVEDSLLVESIVGQVVDTCEFTVYDRESEVVIPAMSELVITRLYPGVPTMSEPDPGPEEGPKLFAGYISSITGRPEARSRYWDVGAQDYTLLLDRSLVIQSYPADFRYDGLAGDRAIIAAAFEQHTVGLFGSSVSSPIAVRTYVQQGLLSLAQQEFRYSTLREVTSQLAQYVGFDFYVDYDKELHYYYRESEEAPYELSDQTTVLAHEVGRTGKRILRYRDAEWERDGTRLVNTFALFGDRLLSDAQTLVMAGTGSETEFDLSFDTIRLNFPLLPEPGESTVRVDVNTGANRALTVSAHSGATSDMLTAPSGQFVTDGVVVGDVVLNLTDQSWGVVTAVTQTTVTASLQRGSDRQWEAGDQVAVPTWTAQTVSSDVLTDFDAAGVDVQHDSLGKTLTFNVPPPSGYAAIRLRFTHNFVGGQINSEADSVTRYGLVLARRVVASDVNSAQGIVQKMARLQEEFSDVLEKVRVKVTDDMFPTAAEFARFRDPGNSDPTIMPEDRANARRRFRAGQWVSFTSYILGRDPAVGRTFMVKEFLIHRVTTRVLGGVGEFEYVSEDRAGLSGSLLEYELELRSWETDII